MQMPLRLETRKVATFSDSEKIQLDLDCIQHWSEKWQIKFNSSTMHLACSGDRAEDTMKES